VVAVVAAAIATAVAVDVRDTRARAARSEVQAGSRPACRTCRPAAIASPRLRCGAPRILYRRALVIAERANPAQPEAVADVLHNLGGLEHACGRRMSTGGMTVRTPRFVDTHPSR